MAIEKIIQSKIVPIFSHTDPDVCLKVVETCYKAGLRAFEFTNRTENALDVFEFLVSEKKKKMPDMILGIGTIFNEESASAFIKIGADFIVSPVYVTGIMEISKQNNIPYIPGVFSPAEIYNAYKAGAELLKIFPGDGVSTDYIKAIKGPMPFLKIMVTGGVDANKENVQKWLSSGANCVGIGSKLIKSSYLEEGRFDLIEQSISTCLEIS